MTDPTADDVADTNDTEGAERPAPQERDLPAPPLRRHLNGWIVG